MMTNSTKPNWGSIQFLLNEQWVTLNDCDPNTTILQYLRDNAGLTGTKEGCGSGDCGACTVAVGELSGDQLNYKTLNACIGFVGSLHGKQLLTVEYLKQGDQLHPVQQALVDSHGSQCGFCTPGFVMSSFALHHHNPRPDREAVLTALAGNLCRCTGYRSIIAAAMTSSEKSAGSDDSFSQQALARKNQAIAQLKALEKRSAHQLCYVVPTSTAHSSAHSANHSSAHSANHLSNPPAEQVRGFHSPTTISLLAQLLLNYPKARIVAGGTDLALSVTQQLNEFEQLIYVGNVGELHKIVESADDLLIGAAAPYSDFTPLLSKYYPELGQMIERIGSTQIRNVGTLGGNIANASPIGDMPPPLIALGASVLLRKGHVCRELPLADFFLDYKKTVLAEAEFIEAVRIPKPKPGQWLKVYKVSKRLDDDISAVLAAFLLEIDGKYISKAIVAFGGMAAIPKRASHCEAALLGQVWQQSTIDQAKVALQQDYQPLSDVRASAQYRMTVAANLLQKCYFEGTQPTIDTRVTHYA